MNLPHRLPSDCWSIVGATFLTRIAIDRHCPSSQHQICAIGADGKPYVRIGLNLL
jgi:hypothetical protein